MPYTHFRYIAYEVPTASIRTADNAVVCDYAAGDTYQAIARLPVPADTPPDAKVRLQRLAGVVNFAANRLGTLADNANTLKIFMAPEFYFRPPAALGADYFSGTYPLADVNAIWKAFSNMFAHADFQHWIFIPGTMLWNTRVDPKRPHLYFNTLAHIRGGVADGLNVIEKNQPSTIDGMPVVGVPARDSAYRVFHQTWRNRKKHVVDVSGVPVGFEICLDHLNSAYSRVLKNVLSDWRANEGGALPGLKLHILCAAGMSIQDKSVCPIVNGYILRNDGIAKAGARSELKEITRYQSPDPLMATLMDTNPADLNGTATLGAAIAEEQAVDIPGGALRVPSKGAGYSEFTQRVLFYPSCALP